MTRIASLALCAWLALALSSLGCVSSEPEKQPAPEPKPKPAPTAPVEQVAPTPEPTPEPEPEPSTPEEIELARKAALMEGRDADALKYCDLAGIAAGKSDEQALLGCALAACRGKDMDKARAWAQGLGKDLLKEAKKICRANGAPL